MIPSIGLCECPLGEYQTGQYECEGCPVIGCKICLDTVACDICDTANHFEQSATNSSECQCVEGYWLDTPNKLCEPCEFGCLKCESDVICTDCDESVGFTENTTTTCKCMVGFYNASTTCALCSTGCLECTIAGCDVCDEDENYVRNGLVCKCADGYYY